MDNNQGKVQPKPQKTGIIEEFKKFITKGNVIDLAVGVIIGGAFQKIIASLVSDIVMPVISLITGGIDFTNKFIVLGEGNYNTLAEAQAAGVATFNYGSFITNLINFLLMAVVIFLFVKGINKLSNISQKNTGAGLPTATKKCPYCKSDVSVDATKCPQCTSQL